MEEQSAFPEEENRFSFLTICEDDYKPILSKMHGIGAW